jgi:hypothetical protein
MVESPISQRSRALIDTLENEFARLHQRSCELIAATSVDILYQNPLTNPPGVNSVGENVLRSAAAVEQTAGGIAASLWDDPFEWTLPETLRAPVQVLEYLAEVEQTRQKTFARFVQDDDLFKNIALPSDEIEPLVKVLLSTLVRAAEYQGRAMASLKFFSRA